MADLNFCPFCSAPQHKVANYEDKLFFCKECNKFFEFKHKELPCPKCGSKKIVDSEFPTPDGQLVIQCSVCKKMYAAKEFLTKNNVI